MADRTTEVDQSQPSIARVYDCLLGGKDNYAVDREIGDFFINDLPGSVAIASANRQALVRAVDAMARDGIRQFVDLGSGLPTADNGRPADERSSPCRDGSTAVHVRASVAAVAQAMCAQDIGTVLVGDEGGESMRVVRADTPFEGRAGEHVDLLLRAA